VDIDLNSTRDKKSQQLMKVRTPIVEQCGKCKNITKTIITMEEKEKIADVCKVYAFPDKTWIRGDCLRCTNEHQIIVEKCSGCDKSIKVERDTEKENGTHVKVKVDICDIFISPERKWDDGNCLRCFYDKKSGRINPIKWSKRRSRL